ncbi:NAD(P)H-quinone oxidoreductase subunit M, chloroplastic isoform X2 [Nicotiana sylvestris]|uniref:NAD(P)H-quinone oxidoreductase subunit M, chloroplastic isoform X2 n=1 Tax=Nicotiana sylvestris TaxID=4096 RepID=UPI00388C3A38
MAATSTHMASTHFSMLGYWTTKGNKQFKRRNFFSVSAQQAEVEELKVEKDEEKKEEEEAMKQPRPVEPQINVKSKNMSREYGGQWLSSATRHVRIYAAYIDPETFAFDQTQMDKLTLILDPTDEFVWTDDTCTKVYSYFQELVDHYEVTGSSPHIMQSKAWYLSGEGKRGGPIILRVSKAAVGPKDRPQTDFSIINKKKSRLQKRDTIFLLQKQCCIF